MSTLAVIQQIFSSPNVVILCYLVAANVVLGIAAAFKAGQFQLTAVANFLGSRVLPLVLGYGAASLLAVANPSLGPLRDGAAVLLGSTMVGYILANLKDLGIPIPDTLSAKDLSAALLTPLSAVVKK